MSLREELVAVGRRVALGGALALVTGWILVLLAEQQLDLWPPLAATLAAAALGGLLVLYQLKIYWPRLRAQLLQAATIESPPEQPAFTIPGWVGLLWVALLLLFSWSLNNPFFPIFASGLLLGYGLSAPLLAGRVARLERSRVTFYIERDRQTRRRRLVRVLT